MWIVSPNSKSITITQVAYAKKDLKADVIVDMATLTGAQGISTGQYHASILTNNEDMELKCMAAGKISGDLVVGNIKFFYC